LRQAHSLFQIEFSTEGDLVLPLSISSILRFLVDLKQMLSLLPRLPVSYSVYLSFNTVSQKAATTQDATNQVSLYCFLFYV